MKKLIAVDLDGTLLDNKADISKAHKDILTRAMKAGHKVAIITGRHFYGSSDVAKELDFDKYGGILSSSNGANVYDFGKKENIINHDISPKLAREMIDFGTSLGFDFMIYEDGKIMAEKKDAYSMDFILAKNKVELFVDENLRENIDFGLNKIVFAADPEVMDKNFETFRDKFSDSINSIHSMPQFIDAMPKGIHKGKSLLEIADYFGIKREDTIAFGDEMNDDTMIEAAGTGVAMANANPEIKKIADEICPSNQDDGIAIFLENRLFGK